MLTVMLNQQASAMEMPSEMQINQWAQASYLSDEIVSVSISIVDESESSALNRRFRQKDCASNVLSFPMEMPNGDGAVNEVILGDVVICAKVVERQAHEQNKCLDAHWAHMIVHGMLHLQGFDHEEEKDAEEMEALEIETLQKLGFQNPYEN